MNLVASTSFVERLGSMQIPVLIVAAASDPLHAVGTDAISASWPNTRLERLDCGPEIPIELPEGFAHLLGGFVGQLP